MSDNNLEIVLNSSGGEVECFLDPDNEVFFGPVTEREREIRRPLPRKTLHPCEITEISKRGMTFQEWEDFKEQVHKNEMNNEAINDVYGLEPNNTDDSFNSCLTLDEDGTQKAGSMSSEPHDHSLEESVRSPENQQDISGVGSLNDTWEIQERMLALAEKLERGEEIPELGITRHPSGMVEYAARKSSNTPIEQLDNQLQSGLSNSDTGSEASAPDVNKESIFQKKQKQETEDCASIEGDSTEIKKTLGREEKPYEVEKPYEEDCFLKPSVSSMYHQRKTPSVEELAKEMDCLFLAQSLMETPVKANTPKSRLTPSSVKMPRPSPRAVETPIKTPTGLGIKHRSTPIQRPNSLQKSVASKVGVPKNVLPASSPVGMYIRSLPEPILIENVRSAQKKKQINSTPTSKPIPVAVKNKEGRWSTVRTPRTSTCTVSSKENTCPPSDIVPVLPTVLHAAAATLIDERSDVAPSYTPGTRGKIGKLLERGMTPTVMKHQGRIQMTKDNASSSKVIHSPISVKSAQRSNSLMEVSVLEAVQVAKSYTPGKATSSRK